VVSDSIFEVIHKGVAFTPRTAGDDFTDLVRALCLRGKISVAYRESCDEHAVGAAGLADVS